MNRLAAHKNKIKLGKISQSIFKTFFLSLAIISQVHFAYAVDQSLIPNGKATFLDNNGKPLSSGKVFFYNPSTTTPKTTYKDIGAAVSNTNPIILDAAGRALIWGIGNYRQVVKDKNDNLIWDVTTSAAGSGSGGGGTATGDGDLVGTIKPWAGIAAPNQYMFTYGQEVSRTTYSILFTAITSTQTIFCNSGSAILTGLSDTTNFWVGMSVEVGCVSGGVSTIISKTSSSVTLAANANLTENVNAVFFPWGRGNGTTTFNLPDFRGLIPVGNNIMGGVASANISNTYFGSKLAESSGAQGGSANGGSVALGLTNLPTGITSNGSITGTAVPASGHLPQSNVTMQEFDASISGGGAIRIPSNNPTNSGTIIDATSLAVTGTSTVTSNNTGSAGNAVPFGVLPPSKTVNYIIKVTPDTNSSSASGVTSLGGMTGDIACGTGITCTGNIISSNATPGSPNNSVQYNNGGSFGGDSSFTYATGGPLVVAANVYFGSGRPWVDVKSGANGCAAATGNGSTDDQAAIQCQVTYVKNTFSGGIVYFPPGNYHVGSTVTVGGSVILQGSGLGGSGIFASADITILAFDTSAASAGLDRLQIGGFQNSAATADMITVGINALVNFSNCSLVGGHFALNTAGTDGQMLNCTVVGWGTTGGGIFSTGANWYNRVKIDQGLVSTLAAFSQSTSTIVGVAENHFVMTDFSGSYTYSLLVQDTNNDAITVIEGSALSSAINITGAHSTILSASELGSTTLNAVGNIILSGNLAFSPTSVSGGTQSCIGNNINISCPTNVPITNPVAIKSNSASAFAVGPNGATHPVFSVGDSAVSQATGIIINGFAAGSRVQILATSSATDEGIDYNAKGAGDHVFTSDSGTAVVKIGNGAQPGQINITSPTANFMSLVSAASATGTATLQTGTYTIAGTTVPFGGTGQSSFTTHCVVLGNGTSGLGCLNGSAGNSSLPLISQGASIDPIYSQLSNAALLNPSTTVNGQTCTLGSTCTITAAPSGSAGGDLTGTYPNPTIANITTGATVAGTLIHSNIAAPSSPAAGKVTAFTDSTDMRFHDKNASGVIGTTVVADTGASNNFLTAISAAGAISKAQPAFSNLSGTISVAQVGGSGASHAVPVDVAGTITWKVVTDCNGATTALNYTQSTDAFSCNSSITANAVAVGGITGLGTGVAAALAVNIGTAGSFVVNGGALGSPSSAGTMPSFTNGGTITGGAYASATGFGLTSGSTINWNSDTFIGRGAAANIKYGQADTASPVAQTISVQNVVAGTSNTAGAALTIAGSQGTGTGVGGAIHLQVAPAGTTGTAQNALSTAVEISGTASVGVGTTTTTSARFTVEDGSGNNQLDLRYTGKTGFLGQQQSNGNFAWNLADNAQLSMTTNNGSGGTITLSAGGGTSVGASPSDLGSNNLYVQGKVSIGTTSVSGTALNTSGTVFMASLTADTATTDRTLCQNTSTNQIMTGTGTLGACLGTSSARYKNDIAPMTATLNQLSTLKPTTFFYKKGHGDDGARRQFGFLAEDLDKSLPALVHYDADGKPNSIDMLGMVPFIVQWLQELKADNDNLHGEIKRLRTK